MRFILIFAFATGFHLGGADPCNNYTALPFADLRFVHNMYNPADVPINDRYLTQAWYRAGEEDMPTSPPKLMSCGTKLPIWLNGTIPPVSASAVSRSACLVTGPSCTKKYSVKVKNCGRYRVYFLGQTVGSGQAYCFGVGESGVRPSYTPLIATVILGLTPKNGTEAKRYTGYCKFDKRIEKPELFYQVTWYVNDVFLTSMRPVHYISVSHIILDESNLLTLGKNVSCSVRARTTARGPPGLSVRSEEVFIGIKVLTPFITIFRGQTGVIRLQPTAPIGCYRGQKCELNINLMEINHDGCYGITTLENTFCGTTISTQNTSAVLEIEVANEEDDRRERMDRIFDVNLQTDLYPFHQLWSYYKLPVIKIHVRNRPDDLPPGVCSAHNDPHMMTFDQRPYDIQYSGDFIMYKHADYPIQVQTKFRPCNFATWGIHGGKPYCVWGVAVQTGRDVFVIDKKHGYADFRVCKDAGIEVWRKGTTRYRIYTPIGTRIDVNVVGPRLTAEIYPSVRDKQKTEGLCGTLNNDCPDDFKKSDNTYFRSSDTAKRCAALKHMDYDYDFQPKPFSDSWLVSRVPGAVNLFDPHLNVTSLKPWIKAIRRCICTTTDSKETTKINCTAGMVSTCPRLTRGESKVDTCKVHINTDNTRFKRSTQLTRSKRDLYHRNKRKSKPADEVHMTEAQARSHCESALGNSKLFQLCGNVPNVNPHHSVQMCIMDIMLSNSTVFTDSSREALQGSCLAELELNTTLETEGVPGHPSIASAIKEIACPGNCSDSGICVNGTCKCDDGFGGPDCSIDLSIYLHCLRNFRMVACVTNRAGNVMLLWQKVMIFLAEGHLKCNMTPFWYDIEGVTHGEIGTIVTADIQTFMNLFCPLTLTRRKRDTSGHHADNTTFIEGYHVSLSNDGIHFSDVHTLFIFDSKCQTPVSDGTKQVFVLKEGYCFINNQCVDENDINPADVCQTCNPAVSAYKWSKKDSDGSM
ncbi:von Willebrand factor D and EGF domain-containing protein-like [Argopecten irradians]|uniref:von Willebrand factor D and EGF domain-containing protein-like n=1 Tax=Argopecten irradians TaxID=31199 RepID=UPI003717B6B7